MLLDFYKPKESGFSVMNADELYYVNGRSFSWSGLRSAVGAGTGAMTGVGVVTFEICTFYDLFR